MNKNHTDALLSSYLQPIFGYVVKRTASLEDAEDLSQEIMLRLHRKLSAADGISRFDGYVWQVVRNAVINYYRTKHTMNLRISSQPYEDHASSTESTEEEVCRNEMTGGLRTGLSRLVRVQREVVVLHYYYGLKVQQIAKKLDLKEGTVKWHLFEARRTLKEEMNEMRHLEQDLSFNPVRFKRFGTTGEVGLRGTTEDFLRSVLTQNIIYAAYHEPKGINEIGKLLNVSPVFIESEVDYLVEFGFLETCPGGRYRSTVLIRDYDESLREIETELFSKAAAFITKELHERLSAAGILEHEDLYYPDADKNFLMWSLIPYVLNERIDVDYRIPFEQVAIPRPDGGNFIAYAHVDDVTEQMNPDRISMMWNGPLWNEDAHLMLWQINHDWNHRADDMMLYSRFARRDMGMLHRFLEGETLSDYETALLAERGYVRKQDDRFILDHVLIRSHHLQQELITIGTEVKQRFQQGHQQLLERYRDAILRSVPGHLRNAVLYDFDQIFSTSQEFLTACMKELLDEGILHPVGSPRDRALTSIIILR